MLLTYPVHSVPLLTGQDGVDGAYIYLLNYAFAHGWQFGRDLLFTYGPLGFLAFPQPIEHNVLVATVLLPTAKWAFLFAFLTLGWRLPQNRTPARRAMLAGMAVAFGFITSDFGTWCALLAVLAALWHAETEARRFLALAVAAGVAAVAFKISYGAVALGALGVYGVWRLGRTRRVGELAAVALGVPIGLALVWLGLYRDVSGLPAYLLSALPFSTGNSSAMTLSAVNGWPKLAAFAALTVTLPLWVRQRGVWLVYALLLPGLLLMFKYGFSRQDHQFVFVYFVAVFDALVLSFVAGRRWWLAAATLAVAMICLNSHTPRLQINLTALKGLVKHALTVPLASLAAPSNEALLRTRSEEALAHGRLEPAVRARVGTATIDVYPWDNIYVPANGLSWRPRPVPLSYVAYTPWLDRRNADYLRSARAPRFLLWDLQHREGAVSSIDGRYLLSDEPLTVYQILDRYRLVMRSRKAALFERRTGENLAVARHWRQTARWGEWIKAPVVDGGILRAGIHMERPLIGTLKRMLYKDDPFYIEYRLLDGSIHKHRLVVDNAASGAWISPYVTDIRPSSAGTRQTVEAIRLSSSPYNPVEPELVLNWEAIRVRDGLFSTARRGDADLTLSSGPRR